MEPRQKGMTKRMQMMEEEEEEDEARENKR
jgi:hypothetical protein